LSEVCPGEGAADDRARVKALLHWIDGKDCSGSANTAVPVVMGISLSVLGDAKTAANNGNTDNGYADATGTPAAGLTKALEAVDASIGLVVVELKAQKLFDSTWIVVSASYGQAPITARARRSVSLSAVKAAVEHAQPGAVAHISASGVAMIWLKNASSTAPAVKALGAHAEALGIDQVISGTALALMANLPSEDSRMPDILLTPREEVRWTPAGRGSATDADAHVALLVSGVQLTGRVDKTPVPTTQLAPLLLRALGVEKFDLQALHKEHSPALPGIF
jgi:arylsulfatase A-like enzyme